MLVGLFLGFAGCSIPDATPGAGASPAAPVDLAGGRSAPDLGTPGGSPDDGSPSPAPGSSSKGNATSSSCAIGGAGRLVELMSSIRAKMAGANTNAVPIPTPMDRDSFAGLVVRVLDGDDAAACSLPPSYRLLVLRDSSAPAGAFRVVAELDSSGDPAPALHWGVFAAPATVPTPSRALAIEAPHSLFDTETELQATDMFARVAAHYLVVAGSDRCADSAASGCRGSTSVCGGAFRVSDASHSISLPFFAVHATLSTQKPSLLFLQLHGNAQSCPAALVSDGSGTWSDAGPAGLLAAALIEQGIGIGKCGAGFPTSGCNLCGTQNVEASMTAGSADACTMGGSQYGRFIHVEQQRAPRTAGSPEYLGFIAAVQAAFPAS
jgi:hypothetical protein